MKKFQSKGLLLSAVILASAFFTQNILASETVTIPLVGSKWHCTAKDSNGRSWEDDGHSLDAAQDNAISRCKDHSNHPHSCEVHRQNCHQ